MALAQDVLTARPSAGELLVDPIQLPDCPGVRVVEWRADSHADWTGPSRRAAEFVNKICSLIRRYPEFLNQHGLSAIQEPVTIPVALLPGNTLLDGRNPRNLNDQAGRFATVVGRGKIIWGVYDTDTGFVFVRNDPITKGGHENRYFGRVFLHEMAHALNDKWGVQARYFPGDRERDEKLADEWANFAGYDIKDDSSQEDCYRKGFGDNICIR